jgi:hemolysin activation/secretion protein
MKHLTKAMAFYLLAFCGHAVVAQTAIPPTGSMSAVASLHRDQIKLQGVSVYDASELLDHAIQKIASSGQLIDLQNISETIRDIYREDGYFLAHSDYHLLATGAEIRVSEGKIFKIEVSGFDAALSNRIVRIVSSASGHGPVRLHDFERGIMLAKDLSGVRLSSEFVADDEGRDVLRMTGNAVKHRGSLTLDNLPRNWGEGIYGVLTEEVYSTLTPGDMVRLNLLPSMDFNKRWNGLYGTLTYRAPLNDQGLYGEFLAGSGLTRNRYTGPNQTPSNSWQRTNLATALLGYPIFRDVHSFIYTLSQVDYFGLSGSETVINDSTTTVLRQTLTYSHSSSQGQSTKLSLTASGGTHRMQGTASNPAHTNGDAHFTHLRLGAGIITPLDKLSAGLGLRLEGSAQYTRNSLPSVENYFIGDRTRLRGYGYAEVIGDSGYAATAELSQFIHLGKPYLDSVSPFIFLDVGSVKQKRAIPGSLVNQAHLTSIGVGFQTASRERLSMRFWYGVPLTSIPNGTQAHSPAVWLQLTQAW